MSHGATPKGASEAFKSDAAAAHVLLDCLLGRVPVALEAPEEVVGAIRVLAEAARRLLPDVAMGLWPGASEEEPYDEVRDKEGHVRPAYKGVVAHVEQILWPGRGS